MGKHKCGYYTGHGDAGDLGASHDAHRPKANDKPLVITFGSNGALLGHLGSLGSPWIPMGPIAPLKQMFVCFFFHSLFISFY